MHHLLVIVSGQQPSQNTLRAGTSDLNGLPGEHDLAPATKEHTILGAHEQRGDTPIYRVQIGGKHNRLAPFSDGSIDRPPVG
jgi:hypothetical protein